MANQFKINEAEGKEKITCKLNGNTIIFAGLDDTEKLKSIYNITSIWIEEASEIELADFLELNRRMRGYKGKNKNGTNKYMQFMISFNPISSLHWLKSYFVDRNYHKLFIWDLLQSKEAPKTLEEFEALIIHSTYKDNKFIDEEYKKQMEDMKQISEYDYLVYALGLWGITGHTYFNAEKLNNRITEVQKSVKPIKQGYFEYKTKYNQQLDAVLIDNKTIKWVDDPKGYIAIYEDVKKGYPYVIGGDSAGEGSDWNIGQVINNITDKQVATLRINFDEDLYANQMYCLGIYFNTALIGIETNFSTHPMKVLTKLQYPKQYVRESKPDAYTGKLAQVFGFNTNKATRPDALGILRSIVRERAQLIYDITTLNEMAVFIINEKGRPEAAEGQHDDTILALAIAYYIRTQQRTTIELPQEEKKRLAWMFEENNSEYAENGGFTWN